MTQKVQILLEDDIDGTEATQSITFGLDGTTYEIDLNDKNAERLRKALAKFVEHGRRVRGAKPSRTKMPRNGHTPQEIRDWARTQKIEVPERGRIPNTVQEAFDAAH